MRCKTRDILFEDVIADIKSFPVALISSISSQIVNQLGYQTPSQQRMKLVF